MDSDPSDPMETCPYNPSHRILRSRMQYHLVKCSRQHAKTTKKHCYFDTTHLVDEIEFESHLATCPSNGKIHLDRFVTVTERSVGIPLEEVNNIQVASPTDNWDKFPPPPNTYNPEEHVKDRGILRTTMTVSKSQRKKHKEAERQRLQSLSETPNNKGKAGPPPFPPNLDNKPIRAPRNLADAGPPIITRSSTKNTSLNNTNNKDEIANKNDTGKIHESGSSCSKENQALHMKESSMSQVQSKNSVTQHCNGGTNGMNISESKLTEISFNSLSKSQNVSHSQTTKIEKTQAKAKGSPELAELRQKITTSPDAAPPTCGLLNSIHNGNQASKFLPPTGRGCRRLYQQIENLDRRPGMRQDKVADIRKQTRSASNGGCSSFIGYGSFDDSEISSDLNLGIENLIIK